LIAASLNVVFGLLVAWGTRALPLPGHRLVDALVDLPFAAADGGGGHRADGALCRPTAGSAACWSRSASRSAFTPLASSWRSPSSACPFVVRTVQPVLQDLEVEHEEAAASLGADRWQTFTRVMLPGHPARLTTGFGARLRPRVGEYGSVISSRQHAGRCRRSCRS